MNKSVLLILLMLFGSFFHAVGKKKSDQLKQKEKELVKKIKNTKEKYQGFQDAVGSWDKYGDKDYSIDGFDYGEI